MKLYKFFGFLILFVGGLFLGAALIIRMDLDKPVMAFQKGEDTVPSSADSNKASSLENAFISVSKEAGPAVVSISTEITSSAGGQYFYSPFEGGDFFERFFKDFLGEIPKKEFKSIGLGSGIIIDPEGYILTNEHVIHNADKITVTLSDGKEFSAALVGKDYRSDIAILKIKTQAKLPFVKLGDTKNVKIGQWAIAIGNSFGFAVNSPKPTITVGVISALHRSLPATEYRDRIYTDLIQTDAAINPGNSGGPLLNLKGEVVGINVAIYTTSGGYQGIGFAIPIDQAKYVLDKLLKGEEVEYGWLGIQIQNLNQELADYWGVPDHKGALVIKAIKGGPADNAGIKEGDVIRKLNGSEIENTKDLMNKVMHTKVGKSVKCEIVRDKNVINLEIKLGKRPLDEENVEAENQEYIWRGITAVNLSEDLRKKYGIAEEGGVIVSKVEPNSAAWDAGIKTGDVIFEINRNSINNLDDFKNITNSLEDKVLIKTQRGYILIAP